MYFEAFKIHENFEIIQIFFRKLYEKLLEKKRTQEQVNNNEFEKFNNILEMFSQQEVKIIKNFIQSQDIGVKIQDGHLFIQISRFILEANKFLKVDISKLSRVLNWKGFEEIIAKICEENEYRVVKNFRFSDKSNFYHKTNQKRYEIDIIAILNNHILLIDAKHWNNKTNNYSSVNKASILQKRRVQALEKNLEVSSNLISSLFSAYKFKKIKSLLPFKLIPVVVTLNENKCKLSYGQVPIVSIFELNTFIQELSFNMNYFYFEQLNSLYIQKSLFEKY